MANLTITNTFTAATTAVASQANTNFTDIKTWVNNRDNATDFWLNMKVSGTASNPAEIKSSAADCEFDIDCTGTNGTPRISWRRSGTGYFTAGVDGAASNAFKFGTTGLTANVAFQVPTTGSQVLFANGTSAAPSISLINDTGVGFYRSGSGVMRFAAGGANVMQMQASEVDFFQPPIPVTDNSISCGANGARWTAVWAVNGSIQTSHSSTKQVLGDIPEDTEIPRGIFFKRPGSERVHVGFLADNLPKEAFYEDGVSIETSAPIGVLCTKMRAMEKRLAVLESHGD